VLQHIVVCCNVLQRVAVYCSVLQCVAVCCSVLQCVAVCCGVLQCVAVCCSVLQCVVVCCSVLQRGAGLGIVFMWCFHGIHIYAYAQGSNFEYPGHCLSTNEPSIPAKEL